MNARRGIVFDLDGTLIDSVADVTAALNRALAADALAPLSVAQVRTLIGEGVRPLVEGAWRMSGAALAEAELEDRIRRYKGEYHARPADHTMVYDGVRDGLERLRGQGLILGICTNKPYDLTMAVLQALGLLPLFAGITGGDNVPRRKPDGAHVLDTLRLMDCPTAGAIMVGDSITDVAAARDAGLPVAVVSWGYALEAHEALGADAVVADFAALEAFIERLGR